ncbi:MAG: lipocalin family protein [Lentimicrobium sp.]
MKELAVIALSGLFLFGAKAQEVTPTAVGRVDLEKYAGLWYDIASFPTRFQKDCHCTTAEYALMPGGFVKVVNQCRKGGFTKRISGITGKAYAVEGSNNTKLKVQFFWPFRADYWIVKLDIDYKWAVVSTPEKDYLWLLSRGPVIQQSLFDSIVNSLKNEGYNTAGLRRTPQACD